MKSCVFPGSFDPVTKGHVDLINRAASLFDRVTVTVMRNIHKSGKIRVEDRINLLRKACAGLSNVRIESWDGLLTDYMRQHGETVVIRGLRGSAEFEKEYYAFAANRSLFPAFETVFLPCDPSLTHISSSAVREISSFGGDIRPFVPENLTEEISELMSKE
jgi:pantetheine-phosphate adenylyltransferase, bacterial